MQIFRQTPFQPFALQFGGRQQLAYVIVQFTAESVAFVFLDFEQAVSKFLRLELDGFA